MDTLHINATDRTPHIVFEFDKNHFSITGESYPEDISAFYGETLRRWEAHIESLRGAKITFEFAFVYFNSSSAKIIMRIFEALERAAEQGNTVVVNWHYGADDDNMQEMGEEFSEDLKRATFNLVAK